MIFLCLALCGVILAMLAMFFNYNLKLSQKQVELRSNLSTLQSKGDELKKEIQQVERVNGKEKKDIRDLQSEVQELKNKLKNHDRK
jgi:septal ring factor EnvC (AmiA/AmiB activator)